MKQFRFLLFVLAFILHANNTQASHTLGAEITYKCIDALGNYKVTLVYYRDCSGIPTCTGDCSKLGNCTKGISIRGGDPACNGVLFTTLYVSGVSVRDVNYNPICPNSKSNCDNMGCVIPGSITPGIERYEFEGIVNLQNNASIPSSCCTIVLSYEECCRPASVQNVNPANFYTEATLNRCLTSYPNCNSPIYSSDPTMIYCANQLVQFSFQAFDTDFDSLSYAIVPALDGFGVESNYITPYSSTTPLPCDTLSTPKYNYQVMLFSNGVLKMQPNRAPFNGVFAIKIMQWRRINGVVKLIGETRRDFQFFVKLCIGNNPPMIRTVPTGIPSLTPKTQYETCPTSNICFDIIAKDTDILDTTYLFADTLLKQFGLTFTPNYNKSERSINGPREDSYKVCWTPPKTIPTDVNYSFNVKAIDNRCPEAGAVSIPFYIRVNGLEIDLKGDSIVHKHSVHTYTTPYHSKMNWLWTITGDSASVRNNNILTVWWGDSDTGRVVLEGFSYCGSYRIKTMPIKLHLNQGLNELTNPLNLIIYPQPATNKLKLSGDLSNLISGQLLGLDGKKLQTFGKYELQKGELLLNDFPTGVYVLSISDNQNRTSTQKISVVK